jgi:cellulose synthase/poly-beta-1,6-N-acetylglucosamine synthase-like glycosyltransferase
MIAPALGWGEERYMSTSTLSSPRTDVRRPKVAGPDPAAQAEGLAALISLAQLFAADVSQVPFQARGHSGIAVVIPARDEGAALGGTLRSLASQTLRPDRIVVVVNNSTDGTADTALRYASAGGSVAIDVLEMRGYNHYRKAGALNCGIRYLLRDGALPPGIRYLLVMDGDTELEAHFLKRASRVLERDRSLGGVSAACLGKPIKGGTPWRDFLLMIQRIEYGRFAATRLRRNVHTMSGAGSFYRAAALNDLLGQRPDVFEERESNLVEDYETTLALKMRGWRVTSNQGCIAYTDLMPTMQMLLAQRTRWARGTVDEWRRYGWCRATWLSIFGVILSLPETGYEALVGAMLVRALVSGSAGGDARFLLLAAVWSAYQGLSVRHLGWKVVLFEMALIPEAIFNLIRTYWFMRSLAASYLGRARAWI